MSESRRWLLPFRSGLLSRAALTGALEAAAAAHATLVPAYLALMPADSSDDAPLLRESTDAMPLLEAVDQLGSRAGVEVETRVERGRDLREALELLLEHERHERVLVAERREADPGFEPEDVEWLRGRSAVPVVVLDTGDTP